MQQIEFNIFFFISVFKKYSKYILSILILAIVASIIFSFLLPVMYEAKVTFYPYSPESSDPRLILSDDPQYDIFSGDDQSGRFMLIGKSEKINTILIQKYKLYKRYAIDSSKGKESFFKVNKQLSNFIKFKKGEYGAVIISVLDFNRDTAALMANDIVKNIELLTNKSIREKNQNVLAIYKVQYDKMKNYVNGLKDSLKIPRTSSVSINAKDKKSVNPLLLELNYSMEDFTKMKSKYDNAVAISEKDLRALLVIEEASPPYEKARPFRTYIVGSTFILTLLACMIIFSLFEYYKSVKHLIN